EFRNWAVTFLTNNDPAVRPGVQASILAFMEDAIAARKIQPRDDIISDLIRVEIEGRPISHEEVIGYCMLLFLAGLDTVVTALSWGVRHLALYPELQQHIRRDPAITRAVVEESLRRYSFVSPTRIVTEDCDFDGVALRRDDVVVMSSSAANLDPAAFEDPLAFKLNRKGPPHVAFNTGPHNCLGAPLARLELATAYQVMCERIPGFQLDASAPTEFDGGGPVSGIRKLHLVW
ncbi:MAG: cytochrome P450, partial [bacterium]